MLVQRLRSILDNLGTKEKALAAAYQELSASYRNVGSSLPGVLYQLVKTPDGPPKFTYISPSCENYIGVGVQELLADPFAWEKNIHPDDRTRSHQVTERAIVEKTGLTNVSRITGGDGKLRTMRHEATYRLRDDGASVWDGMAIDITDLEAANEAKGEFLATMSHELRTPLNGIIGFAKLIGDNSEDAQARENARVIQEMGLMLTAILNDILDLSRIESGKLQLEWNPFDSTQLLSDVARVFALQAREKQLQFEHRWPQGMPHLLGDALRLRQVLSNLLSNAIKFTSQGEVRIEVRTQPATGSRLNLTFTISDTGIGIPADAQQRLFQRFSRVEGRRRFSGTGLGLAICKDLVDRMGGRIGMRSQPGSGSEFWFSIDFPLAAGKQPELSATPDKTAAEPETTAPLNILVDDDYEINRRLLDRSLSPRDHRIILASDGVEAVYLAEQEKPHLILMDVDMPVMDGHEAARRIRAAHGPHEEGGPMIVAMTGNVFESDVARALSSGMDGHLAKPIDFAKLAVVIARAAQAAARDSAERKPAQDTQ
ncbi:MAG: ATP-binding protein [Candidatus Protistobacter heckmanni]|nr:ATP-binding protein [Candidatus Protistobacter heckmanni]